jgi:pyruvate ferredoxin oxidoreductase gamma subunit
VLGGFAALSGVVTIASLIAAVRQRFASAVAEGNVAAAEAAYRTLRGGVALLEPSRA